MKYNFDEIINRRGTHSIKWDLCAENVLPMWVADMDFKTAPEITEALSKKASPGIYGYSLVPDEFYNAIIGWWKNEHQFLIQKEWLLASTGMLPTLSAIVRAFVKPGENIILQTPVYNHFFTILENCGCNILSNELLYKDGNYSIDFEDLESKASHPDTKLLLISNPHNPVGRVYTTEELEKMAEICSRNKVMVVSDEIHSDLVFGEKKHISFASVTGYDVVSVTCGSPCKTFNLSGLPISYVICKDAKILNQIKKLMDVQETGYPNSFAVEALIAGYSKGKSWVEELKVYLYENYKYLSRFFAENLPEVKVLPLEATYLVWLDCSALNKNSEELSQILLDQENLWLNAGTMYGSSGEGFLRINIACPKELLQEGLRRFGKFYSKTI
ncbi:MalY/PatB family protein [Chryseobacterium daeguense]|uniref:MalY/PatB family protein n=1 Tax=Chryseobacterium daeguense TaxID=412438 RepID=UPI0003FC7356|nr:MalY/PatB family protein [Chryseobacterium daeguense]